MKAGRVRRVEVPQQVAASFARSTANYAAAFAVTTEAAGARTPAQWARAVFEGAPAALRWCMVFGWTRVLGLRLGASARRTTTCSGGRSPTATWCRGARRLIAESRFLRACNT